MVVTKLNITFVIDEKEPSKYTLEGSTYSRGYGSVEVMIRRTPIKSENPKEKGAM